MKKIARLIIIVFLLEGIFNPTLARAYTIKNNTKAVVLNNLGIYPAVGKDFGLSKNITRIEGVVLLVKLLGKESIVLKSNYSCPFTDVSVSYRPYIGYLYQIGLIDYKKGQKFGQGVYMNSSEFVAYMLNALGYSKKQGDFNPLYSLNKAVSLGIISSSYCNSLKNSKYLLKDDAAAIIYNLLSIKTKNTDKTLTAKLVEDEGTVNINNAIKYKLYEDKEVTFEDKNLEDAIRKKIGKTTGPLYETDMAGITTLDVNSCNINSLNGIENLFWLKQLIVMSNNITDISPLKNLTKLEYLNLDSNKISDLTPISNLKNLYTLGIGNNLITDISPVSNLTNLKYFYDYGNQIKSYKPLISLKNLTMLQIDNVDLNEFPKLSFLKSLILFNNDGKIKYENDLINLLKLFPSLQNLIIESYYDKIDTALSSFKNIHKFTVDGLECKTETGLTKYNNMLNKIGEILAEIIKPGMTDLEKEKSIHDYICLHTTYAKGGVKTNEHLYRLLFEGKGVCSDYAIAAYVFLNKVGIECMVVSCGGHAWNIVKINGKYYNLDLTFDDNAESIGILGYNFFNVSDDEHNVDIPNWDRYSSTWPKCTDSMRGLFPIVHINQ